MLKGEAKIGIEGTNGIFYPTALKLLKREFGNPLVVFDLKMKELFERPLINGNDQAALHKY